MRRSSIWGLGLVGALVLYAWSRTRQGQIAVGSLVEEVVVTARRLGGSTWTLPPSGEPYRAALEYASSMYGIPWPLLARVAWQESRFRPDIISGQTRSSAGAVGIMQIIPRWHPELGEAGALDPDRAILYAAKYLRQLRDRFGSWELALAAYNWGPANQARDLQDQVIGNEWPAETRAYVAEITRDVGAVLA